MRIALISSKGGAGKSALAISLAVEAQRRGRRVLLVDADIGQGTCLTWAATAAEHGHPAPTTVLMGAAMHRDDQLPRLAREHDFVVIDTPGRLSDVQRAALMVADVALIPAGPSASDTWALAPTLDVLEQARGYGARFAAALVLNRTMPRTAMARAVREGLRECGVPVLAGELVQRVAHMEAVAVGRGVTTYAPTSPAAAELRAVFDELVTIGRSHDAKEIQREAPHAPHVRTHRRGAAAARSGDARAVRAGAEQQHPSAPRRRAGGGGDNGRGG